MPIDDAATLPTFLVIGAMKAGTTSLWRYLDRHPDVFMAEPKELQFFSEHEWWRGLDWYRSRFVAGRSAVARGEASPSYTRFPHSAEAVERIAATLPDARLLYVVRHPIERIVSQYRHLVDLGAEHRPIDEAVLDEHLYVSTSRYAMQLDRYLRHVPDDRVLVFTTEQLDRDREATMAKVYRFIGVEETRAPAAPVPRYGRARDRRTVHGPVVRLHQAGAVRRASRVVPPAVRTLAWRALSRPSAPAGGVPTLAADVRAELADRLRPDVARLAARLGPSFDGWGLLG